MTQLTEAPVRSGRAASAASLVPAELVGGIGGLVFVVTVVAQNIVRANSLPADDASATKVIGYYAGHLGTTELLAGLYVLGAVGLMCWLGALLSRLVAEAERASAIAGGFAASGIVAMFTMTVASDVALAEYVHRGAPSAGAVSVLWVLHNSVFGLLLVSIGIALATLSAAAAAAGVVGSAWKRVGPLGGIVLAVAGGCTPILVGGSKVLVVGLVGFVVWLLFVASTAVALLRSART